MNISVNNDLFTTFQFPNIWLPRMLLDLQFLEFKAETCNTSSENIVPGDTDFKLTKTDAGEPRYEDFRKQRPFHDLGKERVKEGDSGHIYANVSLFVKREREEWA